MQTIDISAALAEQALVTLAAHIPAGIDIGRPLVATREAGAVVVLTTAGTWWVRPGRIERVAQLRDSRAESAAWSSGVELYRVITGG